MPISLAFNSSPYSYTPLNETPAYGIEETCSRISRAGWERVELAAVRPHLHPTDTSQERIQHVKESLEKVDLTPVHICSHQVVLGLNPASPDPTEREATVEHLRGLVTYCHELDIPSFHFHPGWSLGEQSLQSARQEAINTIERAFDDIELDGVQLLIEPLHWPISDLVHTPEEGVRFAEDLSHDVGLVIDTLQCYLDDIPLRDAIHTAGDLLEVVHLADTDRRPPGDGSIDFSLLVDALAEIGFDGLASTEIWGSDPDSLARRSYKTTSRLFSD